MPKTKQNPLTPREIRDTIKALCTPVYRRMLSVRIPSKEWNQLLTLATATGRTKTDIICDMINVSYYELCTAVQGTDDGPRRFKWEAYQGRMTYLAGQRWGEVEVPENVE